MTHSSLRKVAATLLAASSLCVAMAAAPVLSPLRGPAPDSRQRAIDPRTASTLGRRPAAVSKRIANPAKFSSPTVVAKMQRAKSGTKAPVKPVGLRGSVIFAAKDATPLGVYEFDADGRGTLLAEDITASYGGFAAHGKYYLKSEYSTWVGDYVYDEVYSIADWSQAYRQMAANEHDISDDMAYYAPLDRAYGSFYTADGEKYFGWLDLNTWKVTRIGVPLDAPITGIAITRQGTIYAINSLGELYSYDPLTGAPTYIGDTGLQTAYSTSAVYDEANQRILYGLQTSYDAALYAVDPATAKAEWLFDFDESFQVTGMWFDQADGPDAAPAQAANLTLTPLGGELKATFAFTAPSTTVSGQELSGALSYEVKVDGKSADIGNVNAGEAYEGTVTVDAAGEHTVSVSLSNDAGDGAVAAVTAYVGTDAPQAVPTVTATLTDDLGNVAITWEPVATSSANGGFVDPEATTYTVVRQPGEVVIAENVSALTCTDKLDIPTGQLLTYTYEVTPTYDGKQGAKAASNAISVGCYGAPYKEPFANADALKAFTIIEGEAAYNPNTWKFQNGAANGRCGAWLITPGIYLETGKTYNFSCLVKGQYAYYDEALEVFFGSAPTPEALTNEIFKTGTFRSGSYKSYSGTVSVEADGVYYIGFHNASPSFSMSIYVDDIELSTGFFPQTPQACTDMKVAPYADGSGSAVIFMKAPSTTASGSRLYSINKVVIERDGQLVKTFTGAKPGEVFSVTDSGIEPGEHTWTARAWSGEYEGFEASASAFVGINLPAAPASAKIVKGELPGQVVITWEPVVLDVAGCELLPENVTYAISDGNSVIASELTGTEFTYQAVPADEQNYVQYAVFALTSAGASAKGAVTNSLLVGSPDKLPWHEGIDNGELAHSFIIADGSSSYVQWGIMTPEQVGFADADNSGGMLACVSRYKYEKSTIESTAIAVGEAASPVLEFQYFCQEEGNTNEITLFVRDADNPEAANVQLGDVVKFETAAVGWHKVALPLNDYIGKNIILSILVNTKSHTVTLLDDINIYDKPSKNLRLAYLAVPAQANAGEEFELKVGVVNNGTEPMAAHSVELLSGETVVATATGDAALQPDEMVAHSFTLSYGVTEASAKTFTARLVAADDSEASDNVSRPATVEILLPEHPVVTVFAGEAQGDDALLTWEAPVIPGENEPKTSTFETSTPFATEQTDGWTMVDADGKPSGGIQGVELPGIQGQVVSFFVFDTANPGLQSAVTAHSGSKCLASMYVADETAPRSQDWLISPQLNGQAQTLTLWASSFAASYPETFDVLISEASAELADFHRVAEFRRIPAEWTEYSVDLPEGTQYVAIRCSSENAFMLLVDDITVTPLYSPFTLDGFRLYANGQKVYEGAETSFLHLGGAAAKNSYVVTALYSKGESAPSHAVTVETAGIEQTLAASAIYGVKGQVIVQGHEGHHVTVATPAGVLLWSGQASSSTLSVSVPSGIYIVQAGPTTAKVLVK